MEERERIKEQIRRAFASAQRPPNGALHGSIEGDEPLLIEEDFRDQHDWRGLDADFLDQAPKGFASALSFFSDDALRYFLPAYLIADLDDRLNRVDLASHLSLGFIDEAKITAVNPRRYGTLTRFEAQQERFSNLRPEEAAAIVAYLEHKAVTDEFNRAEILQALANYWRPVAQLGETT